MKHPENISQTIKSLYRDNRFSIVRFVDRFIALLNILFTIYGGKDYECVFIYLQNTNYSQMVLPQLPKAGPSVHSHSENRPKSSSIHQQNFDHLPTIRG